MKFNISSTDLLKGLMDVSKAIPAKSALPILENFLFVLKGDKLQVTPSAPKSRWNSPRKKGASPFLPVM